MDLSSLKNLFDIDLDFNVSNISLVRYEDHGKLLKEGDELVVNVEKLDEEERSEIIDLTQDHFEEEERVLRDDAEKETNDMVEGYSSENQEILNYYEGLIAERYVEMLSYSLHLRSLLEKRDLSKRQIQERKRDIAARTRNEGIYIASLCTAGYFDIESDIHDIYVTMGLNKEYNKTDFHKEFNTLIQNKLIAVFVESDEEVSEVVKEVRHRLAKHQQEDPVHEWIDVRGIGEGCRAIIDDSVEWLEDQYIGFDYDRWNRDDDVYVRIHPHSLPPLN